MTNTLEKNSSILKQKVKFFLFRAVTYCFFLLTPIWLPKAIELPKAIQVPLMVLYIMFMMTQWYLMGKEIDHRLKIYFRVNSSIDRLIYRMSLGMFFMVILFNLLSFLPAKWIYNSFWIIWAALGLFYSWPTRGKIINESVSANFTEFRYLDAFEKTLLALIVTFFVFSIPELPALENIEALKFAYDPLEKISPYFWNFLTVNFYPFKNYNSLFKLGWFLHFYLVGLALFLTTFYAFLRYFVSRRLSILGVFALISSWSVVKILAADPVAGFSTTFSLLWIWTFLWVTKSATYRSGLFVGLIAFWGSLLNPAFFFLIVAQAALLFFIFHDENTMWYRRQQMRYAAFGFILATFVFLMSNESFRSMRPLDLDFFKNLISALNRKAIYSLSLVGFLIIVFKFFIKNFRPLQSIHFDHERLKLLIISIATLFVYSLFFDANLNEAFSIMWPIAFLSLIPLEVLFQSISKLRSRRNLIYLIYIIICLLDSHLEGRVKIFLKLFQG